MVMIKGLWSPEEDEKLRKVVMEEEKDPRTRTTWNDKARKAGLQRSGKSCRRRWMNHLRSGLKRGLKFSPQEASLVLQLQPIYGNKWARIAAHLEGRTDNDVKNLWHGCMRRKTRGSKLTNNVQPTSRINQQITLINDNTTKSGLSPKTVNTLPQSIHRQDQDVVDLSTVENPKIPTLRTAFSAFFSNDYDFELMHEGLWSPEEDEKLRKVVMEGGKDPRTRTTWNDKARKAGLQRCGKSCRRRWMNHLRPGLKRGLKFSPQEASLVLQLQPIYGNKWARIAAHLEGRTDNDVKNLWHGCMRSKTRASSKLTNNDKSNSRINQQITLINDSTNKSGRSPTIVNILTQSIHGQNQDVVDLATIENPKISTLRTALSAFFSNDYDFVSIDE